jgi:hypothetical protein
MQRSNITYHIYIADCFGSSRINTQKSWDAHPVFIHKRRRNTLSHVGGINGVDSFELNVMFLIFLILKSKGKQTFVFHAQPSLPHLLLARFVALLFRKNKIVLVYDIHDLHEYRKERNIWRCIRYSFIRYYSLRVLEYICFRDKSIKKITVSEGMANEVAKQYDFSLPPHVVMSCSPPEKKPFDSLTVENKKALVYFGLKGHAPFELINQIKELGMELHLYGRDITPEAVSAIVGADKLNCVRFLGEYFPNDLFFLSQYSFLILYKPHIKTVNYRIALPNKLFQALNAGLTLIISDNFGEIKNIFDCIPGAVIVLRSGQDISCAIERACLIRDKDYGVLMYDYLCVLYEKSKQSYLQVTDPIADDNRKTYFD